MNRDGWRWIFWQWRSHEIFGAANKRGSLQYNTIGWIRASAAREEDFFIGMKEDAAVVQLFRFLGFLDHRFADACLIDQDALNPAKAIRELGLPQTPPRQALADAAEWFRQNGYVKNC